MVRHPKEEEPHLSTGLLLFLPDGHRARISCATIQDPLLLRNGKGVVNSSLLLAPVPTECASSGCLHLATLVLHPASDTNVVTLDSASSDRVKYQELLYKSVWNCFYGNETTCYSRTPLYLLFVLGKSSRLQEPNAETDHPEYSTRPGTCPPQAQQQELEF
ncbi:hypothetical protein EMCRGX_G033431 [Ephydatia muelleri]|eukprot:Em0022g801a